MKRLDKGGFDIVYLPCRSTAGRSYQHDRSRQFPVINIPSRLHTQQEYPFREIANGYQQSVKNLFNNDPRPSRAIAARPRLHARLRLLLGSGRVHASEIDRYPAAWLTPPRLKEVEGRRHGKRTYEIQLHLLQPGMRSRTPNAHGGSTKWSRRCSESSRS